MVSSKKTSWDLTVPSLIVLQWSHAKGALLSWRSDPFWENWIVGWVLAPPHWPMQPPMPCAQTCPTQVPARPMVAIGIGLTLLWVTLWECGRFQLLWIVAPSTSKSFATDFFNMQMTKKKHRKANSLWSNADMPDGAVIHPNLCFLWVKFWCDGLAT